jgi:thymidylate synthase (FAD)
MERAGYVRHDNWVAAADEIAEFAGRLCYQSWARPNPDTAHNAGYLANIIDHEHFSVLEHASATFYVADVSRSLSHELVRHRHLSFSQVSQRYVDESAAIAIVPPALNTYAGASVVGDVMNRALVAYEKLVAELLVGGVSRKEARQAARAVLPNATETKFVVTGNMRAWRDVIAKRISPTADAEIRQLADELLARLRTIAPNTFQDM